MLYVILPLQAYLQTLPDLGSSCVPEGPSYTYGQLRTHTWGSSRNTGSSTLQTDNSWHDRPAVCCLPAVFFRKLRLVAFSLQQEKIRLRFQYIYICIYIYIYIYYVLKIAEI